MGLRFAFQPFIKLFLYKALKCYAKFVVNSQGVAFDIEPSTCVQILEVQPQATVGSASHRNVIAFEKMRIALNG